MSLEGRGKPRRESIAYGREKDAQNARRSDGEKAWADEEMRNRAGKENCKEKMEISLLRCWKFQCRKENTLNKQTEWVNCGAANDWKKRKIEVT